MLALIKYQQDQYSPEHYRQEHNDLILLNGQCISVGKDFDLSLIEYQEKERVLQRSRRALLETIDQLPAGIFDLPEQVKAKWLENKLHKAELIEKAEKNIPRNGTV